MYIECLSCISNAIDVFVTSLNEIIEKELRSVIEKQVERINDYLNFLDQRIQAKTKDIDYLKTKITKKNQKHVSSRYEISIFGSDRVEVWICHFQEQY